MNRLKRYWMMLLIFFHGGGYRRAEFLKKRNYFKQQGEQCYFQPWNFGPEPYMISFGNNVHVASNVTFINHDITVFMFRNMGQDERYRAKTGEIVIGDNVFIGSNTSILYDVHIGNNVIIGAGSVVTKDIPSGIVAAGVPCKAIGKFEDYRKKLLEVT